jgi:predicted transcriptional regulator
VTTLNVWAKIIEDATIHKSTRLECSVNNYLFVSDAYHENGTSAITVEENMPLKDIISIYAKEPKVTGIFLVDNDKHFSGIVSKFAVQKWAQFQLSGKWQGDSSCSEISNMIKSVQSSALARTGNTMGLKGEDTLEKAFKLMVDLGEDVLPVVDAEGRIIGDLTLSEVLLKAIETGCQST